MIRREPSILKNRYLSSDEVKPRWYHIKRWLQWKEQREPTIEVWNVTSLDLCLSLTAWMRGVYFCTFKLYALINYAPDPGTMVTVIGIFHRNFAVYGCKCTIIRLGLFAFFICLRMFSAHVCSKTFLVFSCKANWIFMTSTHWSAAMFWTFCFLVWDCDIVRAGYLILSARLLFSLLFCFLLQAEKCDLILLIETYTLPQFL